MAQMYALGWFGRLWGCRMEKKPRGAMREVTRGYKGLCKIDPIVALHSNDECGTNGMSFRLK